MARIRKNGGQAIIEYVLMVIMVAVVIAITIRSSNTTLYQYWTGLTRQVASPCARCETPPAPDL
ncbi:MAG: hypothetical protein HY537_08560 [Deltaproteobacteria bacterium]|nr:hypothetical protein [Deltaproteobacteria bacterium]